MRRSWLIAAVAISSLWTGGQYAEAQLSPELKEDIRQQFQKYLQLLAGKKIYDGKPVSPQEFVECVAVGKDKDGKFFCSGVLIEEQLVLTAAHCGDNQLPTSVLFGSDVEHGHVVAITRAIRHEKYKRETDPSGYVQTVNDLMLLILSEKQKVPPAKIANSSELIKDKFQAIRVVGFGNTDQFGTIGRGIKRMGDVDVVSVDCAPNDDKLYGATPGLEFVATNRSDTNGSQDACAGDSGGPAYVLADVPGKLAGIVSRATKNSRTARPCGDGGVYERIPEALDWIRLVARENGVRAP